MGVVVDFVSDVVGGVVDVVGDVAEFVVDTAVTVVETVAENPLLLAAAIAAPYALEYFALEAGASAGVGGIALGEGTLGASAILTPGLDLAVGATTGALGTGAATLGVTSAGLAGGAGALGISAAAMEAAAVGTALGATSMASSFAFPGITQATDIGTASLNASDSYLAMNSTAQNVASNVINDSIASDFASSLNPANMFGVDATSSAATEFASSINPMIIDNAKSAVFSVENGIPYADAVSSVGATPNTFGEVMANSYKDISATWDSLTAPAQNLMKNMGETLLPGADPLVQKFATNTIVNTALNGGDVGDALKMSAIGTGAGYVGNQVYANTVDTLGSTGAKIAAGTAANLTGGIASGADINRILTGSAIGALGTGVTNLTDSPLTGSVAKNIAGSVVSGQDVGQGLTNFAKNLGTDYITDKVTSNLGMTNTDPYSLAGIAKNIGTGLLDQALSAKPPQYQTVPNAPRQTQPAVNAGQAGAANVPESSLVLTPEQLAKLRQPTPQKTQTGGLNQTTAPKPTGQTTPTIPVYQAPEGYKAPPKHVDVSTLTPLTDITSLSGLLAPPAKQPA